MAQQFTSHAVKEGETVYSIARQYKVSPSEIMKYNKEIKEDAVTKTQYNFSRSFNFDDQKWIKRLMIPIPIS